MDFSRNRAGLPRHYGGLGIVVLAHVLFAYVLVTNLAHTIRMIVNGPVQVKIIDDKTPPPDVTMPPPMLAAPTPPYIPPPEVPVVQPAVVNPIAVMTTVAPPAQAFAKTVAAPPAAKPASTPIAPPHLPAVPAFADLNACKPEYPRAALLDEEEGTVRVKFVVGTRGQLVSAQVVKSSGYGNLDHATLNGLSSCQFKPGYRDGKPVESSFVSDYVWRLD